MCFESTGKYQLSLLVLIMTFSVVVKATFFVGPASQPGWGRGSEEHGAEYANYQKGGLSRTSYLDRLPNENPADSYSYSNFNPNPNSGLSNSPISRAPTLPRGSVSYWAFSPKYEDTIENPKFAQPTYILSPKYEMFPVVGSGQIGGRPYLPADQFNRHSDPNHEPQFIPVYIQPFGNPEFRPSLNNIFPGGNRPISSDTQNIRGAGPQKPNGIGSQVKPLTNNRNQITGSGIPSTSQKPYIAPGADRYNNRNRIPGNPNYNNNNFQPTTVIPLSEQQGNDATTPFNPGKYNDQSDYPTQFPNFPSSLYPTQQSPAQQFGYSPHAGNRFDNGINPGGTLGNFNGPLTFSDGSGPYRNPPQSQLNNGQFDPTSDFDVRLDRRSDEEINRNYGRKPDTSGFANGQSNSGSLGNYPQIPGFPTGFFNGVPSGPGNLPFGGSVIPLTTPNGGTLDGGFGGSGILKNTPQTGFGGAFDGNPGGSASGENSFNNGGLSVGNLNGGNLRGGSGGDLSGDGSENTSKKSDGSGGASNGSSSNGNSVGSSGTENSSSFGASGDSSSGSSLENSNSGGFNSFNNFKSTSESFIANTETNPNSLKRKIFSSSTSKTETETTILNENEPIVSKLLNNGPEMNVTEAYNSLSDVEIIEDIEGLIRNNTEKVTTENAINSEKQIGSATSVSFTSSTQHESRTKTTRQTESILNTEIENGATTPFVHSQFDENEFIEPALATSTKPSDLSADGTIEKTQTRNEERELQIASIFGSNNPNKNSNKIQPDSGEIESSAGDFRESSSPIVMVKLDNEFFDEQIATETETTMHPLVEDRLDLNIIKSLSG